MCRFLHVLQPFLDLGWLLRGGPPPGPAMSYSRKLQSTSNRAQKEAARVRDRMARHNDLVLRVGKSLGMRQKVLVLHEKFNMF